MDKKLRPVIKWTGGKYDEFALFADHIPTFKRYIEPFFGGGGVFFALKPTTEAFINDKSSDLINFYQQIGNPLFRAELLKYVNAWDELTELHQLLWAKLGKAFIKVISGQNQLEDFRKKLTSNFDKSLDELLHLNEPDFIIDVVLFKKTMIASLVDKARRIKSITDRENRVFDEIELTVHFETGIRSGTYLFFRSLLNKQYHQISKLSPVKAAANWYFVREFCYGAMFRFNKKGNFNIPYGGIAYNKKNFGKKAAQAYGAPITSLFAKATLNNLDFETFLKAVDPKKGDFIFLDPPYDSEFSEYDQSAFTKEDQQRLAGCLLNSKAKWMVVIKETEFIRLIYTHPKVKIITFDKKYTYNMRGRNQRAVTHLIIKNY